MDEPFPNRLHQKERAIALLTANGFLLFQVLSNPERAGIAISVAARVIFKIDTQDHLATALIFVTALLLAPTFGIHEAYRALQVAGAKDEKTSKEIENKLDHAIWAAGLVALVGGAMVYLYLNVAEQKFRELKAEPSGSSSAPPARSATDAQPPAPLIPPT